MATLCATKLYMATLCAMESLGDLVCPRVNVDIGSFVEARVEEFYMATVCAIKISRATLCALA